MANELLTLAHLAESLDGVWHGNANHAIFSLSSLNCATDKDLAYFDNPLLSHILASTGAGAVLIKSEHQHLCPVNSIVVSNPLASMTAAVKLLSPPLWKHPGIHATAQIHQSAQIGQGVSIGEYSVIGENARLAEGVFIGTNSIIESSVQIGKNSHVGCGVVIHHGSTLGSEVAIESGCVIGSIPFNYLKQQGSWEQGPTVGGVIISDKVRIGANTAIDRGSLSDTYLGEGVCIDNLVQIAHDAYIGKNTAIAGCAAIGAYSQIGSDCIIGGASTVAANVRLTDNTVITGMSTVTKSITRQGIYSSGTIVHEHQRWRRNVARFRRLDDYMVKLGTLEKKILDKSGE